MTAADDFDSAGLVAFARTIGTVAETLSIDSQQVVSATIKADDDNSGSVYVGGPNVNTTSAGFRLKAGQALSGVTISDLKSVWIVGSGSGQKVYVFGLLPNG